jgi:RND family efflux transporter MFP subunit
MLSMLMDLTSRLRFVVAFAALCGLSLGCKESIPSNSVKPARAVAKTVAVVEAKLGLWPETIRVQGSLLAYEEAVIGSKLAGRIDEVKVDLGSIVKRGEPLVILVRSELELQIQMAEAQLRQACATIGVSPSDDEKQFDIPSAPGVMMEQALVTETTSNVNRARPLVASRAVTEGEYEALVALQNAAQARYEGALNLVAEQIATIGVRRTELALAEQRVVDSQIVAPFDGVVGNRQVSPGEFVQAGQAVVTLVRADRLRFTAGVPESRAAAIRVGQRVHIELSGRTAPPLVASISRISPTVMQTSRSILIQADVPNDALTLQAGLFAEAEVVVDPDAKAVSVPASAVSRFAGVKKVWLVNDGIAKQQTVRTGREDGSLVEIIEGLSAGDSLVRNADEGRDGPVVAIGRSPSRPLQEELKKERSASSETAGRAQ